MKIVKSFILLTVLLAVTASLSAEDKKTKITIMKFDVAQKLTPSLDSYLYDVLVDQVVSTGKYIVVDWEEIGRLLKFIENSQPNLSEEEAKKQAIKQKGIEKMFVGSVVKIGSKYRLSVKVLKLDLSIEKIERCSTQSEDGLEACINEITEKLISPPKKLKEVHASAQTGKLYVDTKPDNARIRILNIGPKFYQGMELSHGRYHVEVSAKGYARKTIWVSVTAGKERRLEMKLKPGAALGKGKRFTNSIGMKFVYIKPGTFVMGSPSGESGREYDERQHNVTLTKGFYMQTTEVTVGQWRAFVRDTEYKSEAEIGGGAIMWSGSEFIKKSGIFWDNPGFSQQDSHPVTCVSWNDAIAFKNWLNRKGGKVYRLPTEAEWEYSCRAGTKTPFAYGRCLSTNQANYNGYPLSGCSKGSDRGKTMAVARLEPNAWGLYDMHGNVIELCQDWYGDYPSGSVTNPTGPSGGSGRVVRGGCWFGGAVFCRSAQRGMTAPGKRTNITGFRLLRNP